MQRDDPPAPVVRPLAVPQATADEIPGLEALRWAPGRLSLSLRFGDGALGTVEFEGVRGVRVLDEGDLLEFWEPEVRVAGWLWEIERGGWRAHEARRSGFISGLGTPTYREFLVLGQDDCVGVLAERAPRVERAAAAS